MPSPWDDPDNGIPTRSTERPLLEGVTMKDTITNLVTALIVLALAAIVLAPMAWVIVHAWRWALA